MHTQRLDQAAILDIKEMLEDEFQELIDTYKRDIEQKISRLLAELSGGNDAEIRKLAHSMKGASVNLGILYFGELCHRLEEDAKIENQASYQHHIEQIQQEKGLVFQALDELLIS